MLDPYGDGNRKHFSTLNVIINYLQRESVEIKLQSRLEDWKIIEIDQGQCFQAKNDCWNCAIFTIYYMQCLVNSKQFTEYTSNNIFSFRRTLYRELQGKLQLIPTNGLANLTGTTCYLNSVLQCLSVTPHIFEYLVNRVHNDVVFPSLVQTIELIWRPTEGNIVYPTELLIDISKVNSRFQFQEKQDACELLTILLRENLEKPLFLPSRVLNNFKFLEQEVYTCDICKKFSVSQIYSSSLLQINLESYSQDLKKGDIIDLNNVISDHLTHQEDVKKYGVHSF
jgi:Ubiquitin carboxyl-terminal hydrolase